MAWVAALNLIGIGRHHARAAQKKEKFTLCFQNEAIVVSKKAKKRYLAQGATAGACPTLAATPTLRWQLRREGLWR